MRLIVTTLAFAAVCAVTGCGSDSPKTHPIRGKVTLTGGDPAYLAGHHVEAMLEGNPTVRASGVIGITGDFELETIHAGTVLPGAREGKYLVRIVTADEDEQGKRLRKPPSRHDT